MWSVVRGKKEQEYESLGDNELISCSRVYQDEIPLDSIVCPITVLTEKAYYSRTELNDNVYFCRNTKYDPIADKVIFNL